MRLKDENGFTLVEIITVVVVIGIIAAIGIPNYLSWQPNMRLKAEARDLYSNMQKIRILAVKSNRDTAIIFDPANSRYDICDDWDSATVSCNVATQVVDFTAMKHGVGYGHGNAPQQADTAGTAFPLAPDDDVSYAAPANVAVFNSRGLGNAGYVYLDHQDNTTTYAIGSLPSGVIKLFKWNGNTWE